MRSLLPTLFLSIPLVAACADGGTAREPGGGNALPGASTLTTLPGLTSVVAGRGALRVTWIPGGDDLETAIFVSTSRADLFRATPSGTSRADTALLQTGLSDGVPQYVGLGLRAIGDVDYTPVGSVLVCRPGAPIYVDARADPATADGASPATAFARVAPALLTALSRGGGNVWIRGGEYEVANLPLFAGVHVYGGFDADFELDVRDPTSKGTRWVSVAKALSVGIQGGAPLVVMDGIHLDGRGIGSIGIDAVDTSVELRNVSVRGFADRGMRARNSSGTDLDLIFVGADFSANGGDGVSVSGAFDLVLEGSRFDRNGQEGMDLDALVALAGDTARLHVRGCGFAGNASEGLDADLEAPSFPGAGLGRFDVRVDGSSFERNGLDGLLIDLDFEGVPGWSAGISVRGSLARANAGNGIRVDADAEADVFVERVLATANHGDGLQISSESEPGLAIVNASVFAGNIRAGMRATFGNRALVATHCVLAGNVEGGLVSEVVESIVSSSVFWLQPRPVVGSRAIASPIVTDPAVQPFVNVPEAYVRVTGVQGERLTVSPSTDSLPFGADVEFADDGIGRSFAILTPTALRLDDLESPVTTPGSLVAFAPGAGVVEDYRVVRGSPADAAALVAPGALARDAGPFGVASARVPGVPDELALSRFRPTATSPALARGIGPTEPLEVRFSAEVDPASFMFDTVRAVHADGTELAFQMQTSGARLVLAPITGWGSAPFLVELHSALRAKDGMPLGTTIVLPIVVR